jgi:hypothetical protein
MATLTDESSQPDLSLAAIAVGPQIHILKLEFSLQSSYQDVVKTIFST